MDLIIGFILWLFGFIFENGGSGPSFFLNVINNLTDVDFDNGEVTDETIAQVASSYDYFKNGAENYIITGGNGLPEALCSSDILCAIALTRLSILYSGINISINLLFHH